MDFAEFEASFVKANRRLKAVLFLTLLVGVAAICIQYTSRKLYLYQGKTIFEERPLAEEVCRLSFMSLAEGTPHPYVVSSEIIKLVKKEPFKMNVERLLVVKSTVENHCKVVLKSQGKLLAFDVTLQGSSANPFFYQLTQLDEVGATKEEL